MGDQIHLPQAGRGRRAPLVHLPREHPAPVADAELLPSGLGERQRIEAGPVAHGALAAVIAQCHAHLHLQRLAGAHHREAAGTARLQRADAANQVAAAAHRRAVDVGYPVAGPQAAARRRRVLNHAPGQRPVHLGDAQRGAQLVAGRAHEHPQIAVAHGAGLDQVADAVLGGVDRQGKPDPGAAAAARRNPGVEADYLTLQVDQRAAGVAGVDGRVGLDVLGDVGAVETARGLAAERAHDPGGDAGLEPEGTAHRQHQVTHLQPARVAEARCRQPAWRAKRNHRDVLTRVAAHEFGVIVAAVVQRHRDAGGAFRNHVVVGEHVVEAARVTEDDAGAGAARRRLWGAELLPAARRKVEQALPAARRHGSVDLDHHRHHRGRDLPKRLLDLLQQRQAGALQRQRGRGRRRRGERLGRLQGGEGRGAGARRVEDAGGGGAARGEQQERCGDRGGAPRQADRYLVIHAHEPRYDKGTTAKLPGD